MKAAFSHATGGADSSGLVPLDTIQPGTQQPRTVFSDGGQDELTQSVRVVGVIEPLVLRSVGNGQHEIVCGERRWRAAREAGLQEVPAVVRTLSDDEAFSQFLVENLVREALAPIDEVTAVARLAALHGVQEASRILGKPHSWVSKRKRIAESPDFLLEFLAGGDSEDLEAHYELAKLAGANTELARKVIEKHGTGSHFREEVKKAARGLSQLEADPSEKRSHANGDTESDSFLLSDPSEGGADGDRDEEDSDRDDDSPARKPVAKKSWLPSAAAELDEPFDDDPPVLVSGVEVRRAGHIVLATSNGSVTYEFTEQARAEMRALLGPG